jgi:hypothetical protein
MDQGWGESRASTSENHIGLRIRTGEQGHKCHLFRERDNLSPPNSNDAPRERTHVTDAHMIAYKLEGEDP